MKLCFLSAIISLCVLLSFATTSFAVPSAPRPYAQRSLLPAGDWLQLETPVATGRLLQNISPAGAALGVVLASPQRKDPDYYRHWTRDAALSMEAVVGLAERNPAQRAYYENLLKNYVGLSRQHQLSNALSGLGEPIFEVNGEPFRGPWGRPQNDGPALRAVTLIQWASQLLARGDANYVKNYLYSPELPATTVIKADLEYVAHHWQESSFDLWEEVRGDHFFTRMVQRRALLMGALLAERMGDAGAADFYRTQAVFLSREISRHFDPRRNLILPTLNRVEGVDYKNSNIDIAVILGVVRGQWDGFFGVGDLRVKTTFERIVRVFSQVYPINQVSGSPGFALGRYPEDKYSGADFSGGNPWVLATLVGAEMLYELADVAAQTNPVGNQGIVQKLISQGDSFVERVQLHANADGSLSEQISRINGYMVSARDLTWNYAAVLKTAWAREKAVKRLRGSLSHP